MLLVKNMMLTIVNKFNKFINKGQGSSPLQIRARKKSHSLVQDRQIFLCMTYYLGSNFLLYHHVYHQIAISGQTFPLFQTLYQILHILYSASCLLVCLFSLGPLYFVSGKHYKVLGHQKAILRKLGIGALSNEYSQTCIKQSPLGNGRQTA